MFHFLQNGIGQAFNLSVCQGASPHPSITALPVLKQKSIGGNSSCQIVFKNVGRQLIPVITSEWKQNNVVTSLNRKKTVTDIWLNSRWASVCCLDVPGAQRYGPAFSLSDGSMVIFPVQHSLCLCLLFSCTGIEQNMWKQILNN